jgi:predicted amidohydrolase
MRVAVLQVAYDDHEPVAARVSRVADLVREQAGHDLVVLPELWAPGGFSYRTWPERAEPLDGPTVLAMRAAARDAGVVLHAGSIIEVGPDPADALAGGEARWNTSLLIGPDGEPLATYRKVHRFGFGEGEPALLAAGSDVVAPTVPLPASGGSTTLGLATCYDLRFPEMFRLLLDAGARVVVTVAAWPAARVAHWTLLGQARAVENQSYLVACNTAGTHAGHAMGGASQVVAPTGTVLATAGVDQQVLSVDLDLAVVDEWRARFPVLADRRF